MTTIKKLRLYGFKSFPKLTEIEFENGFNCIIGPNGAGKCLDKNALVQLADGNVVKIGDLVEQKFKNNSKIQVDDGFIINGDNTNILALDTKKLKIIKRPIKSYVKRKSPEILIKLKTRSGREIIATKYHPLFILENDKIRSISADEIKQGVKVAIPREIRIKPKTKYFYELIDLIKVEDRLYVPYNKKFKEFFYKAKGNLTWNELAKKIGINYYVIKGFLDKQAINFAHLIKILKYDGLKDKEIVRLIPNIRSDKNILYKIPWKNSKEFARLLGYLLAEGRLPPTLNQIWFTNGTEEIVADYKRLIDKIFGVNATINEYKPNLWDVLAYSVPIRVILTKFGMSIGNTKDKKITNLFLSHSSEEELAEILNGLYSGDGYISKHSIEITTKSKDLANAIETILLRIGINYKSNFVVKVATNTGFSGIYKNIIIYGVDNFIKFYNKIKLIHNEKRSKVEKLLNFKSNPNLDLIDINSLVKDLVKELKINVKKTKKKFPRLDSYVYKQCTPSRYGLNYLIKKLFEPVSKFKNINSPILQGLKLITNSDIYWDEIMEIEEIKSGNEWVYDLSIENDHNYIANNFFVHNSNLTDSICFVLGRLSAKSLRAEKASNLIYNGGKSGNPSKQAEITIIFDNSDNNLPVQHKEVKITRIVKQNGTSTYKVNDKTVTRQQIIDLLASAKIDPDGHNIILQGDIVSFAEMKPNDRREIIEEISGISIYDEKRHKALLELDKVEEKLKEADIILTDRGAHLRELKKDRDQATKYKKLQQLIKDNKATYVHVQIQQKEKSLKEIQNSIDKETKIKNKVQADIDKIKKEIEAKREELKKINEEILSRGESEQIQLHKDVETIKTDLARNTSRLEFSQNEINKLKNRKEQLKNNLNEYNKKISELEREKKNLEKEKEKLDKIKISVKDIDKEVKLSDFIVRKILDLHLEGVHGTIASLGKIERKYELALEVSAGSRYNAIIVENDKVAEKCIKYLRENKLGTAIFLPLNKIKTRELRPEQKLLSKLPGVHGSAINLIKFNSKFKNAFSHVYANTFVIDNLEAARKLGIGRARMVTLEGDLIEQSGAMIGGFRKRTSLNVDNIIRVDSDLKSIITQIEVLLPEQSRNLAILKEQDKELNEFEQEIKKLKDDIKENKSILEEKEKHEKKFYDEFKDFGKKREKINELLQNREITLFKLEENIRSIEQRINTISLDRAKYIAEKEGLQKELEEFKNANIKKTTNLDMLMKEVQKAEQELLMLGNVNFRALEIYEEIEKEFNSLIEKKEKLKVEKQDVFNMMQEIETKKKDLFMKTFNEINNNFRDIFISLSTKGQAFLELEDKENPFNAGLDIKVKIVGNKYLDIRGLSGGEKTLTALAFIFSIQEYQPASFYLLDEVDAALDKTNSEKLSKLINEYSKKAQYILISHNDSVITEADQIYGVSMQDGVSKVIGLKI